MYSHQANPNEVDDKDVLQAQTHFTLAEMATIYNSLFAQGFSNNERQAVIHALLRHGAHEDGAHYHTKSPGGLHPAYFHFNPVEDIGQKGLTRTPLTEAGAGDVFDAVCLILKDTIYVQVTDIILDYHA